MDAKQALLSLGLRGVFASGLCGLLERRAPAQGGILSFHRVNEGRADELAPPSLSVTPANFRGIVQGLIRRGYQFLSMTELVQRLGDAGPFDGKFVCLTFDDGFADNYLNAFPICREFGVPMTVYLVSGFVNRQFPMWSFGLEAVIVRNRSIELKWANMPLRLSAATRAEKRQAYAVIASRFVTASPGEIRECCRDLGARYGVDFMAFTDSHALDTGMIREMHASGLVEFGAHGVHHAYLSRLDDGSLRHEIWQCKQECEAIVGAEICHFAYPYGDRHSAGVREAALCRELGFKSAVTTECNTLSLSDRQRLWSLPRLTYNGAYQDAPLLDLLLSGTLPLLRSLRQEPIRTVLRSFRPKRPSGVANDGPGKRPDVRSREGNYSAAES